MKMKSKTKEISDEDSLRLRVLKAKSKIPFDYTPLYQYEFGPQNDDHLNRVRQVWNLRVVDEVITGRLEQIAEKVKQD